MFSKLQATLITILSLIAMVFAPVLSAASPVMDEAHDDDTFDIVIEGPVQTVNLNVLTIGDILIEVEADNPLLTTIQIGDVVEVGGNVDESRNTLVVMAENVVVTGANILTPIISINGPVQAVNLNIVTVYNFDIQFNPNDAILVEINIGDIIAVSGNIIGGVNIIIVPVQVIIVVNVPDPEATPEVSPDPEATPEVTPEPDSGELPVTIMIEGPVEAINVNILTIYDFDIEVEPTHPMLNIVEIGDVIHIGGIFGNSGVIVANLVSNVSRITTITTGATASLDGPIEAINGNVVIVNGIPVQFLPDDPQLATLQVGDFLNVQGNFENNGTTIVLIIVNVTVINNVIVSGNPYCWYHGMGMGGMGMGMGHWHCDGMGMGGMGMGMGGMGMGG